MRTQHTTTKMLITCGVVCALGAALVLVVALLIGQGRSGSRDLSITLVNRRASNGQVSLVFALSNSTGRMIGGRVERLQSYTNGGWSSWPLWPAIEAPVFYLQPGQATNVQVTAPERGTSYRVPFLWGRVIGTPITGIRLRAENLVYTLTREGRWYGWRNTGGFRCRTNFWNAAESGGAEQVGASNSQPPAR